MPNELTNPNNVVTEERLAQFYQQILPYLGGMPDILANKFSKADLYSTDEKLIGRWIDGKPLYQKVITGLSVVLTWSSQKRGEGSMPATISDISQFVDCIFYASNNGKYIGSIGEASGTWSLLSNDPITVTKMLLKYTKTTDSAVEIGSDTDYSTTEKIVGTWIDGKPLYQKTVATTQSFSLSASNWSDLSVYTGGVGVAIPSNIDTLVNLACNGNNSPGIVCHRCDIVSSETHVYIARTGSSETINAGALFTIQYTKTSS